MTTVTPTFTDSQIGWLLLSGLIVLGVICLWVWDAVFRSPRGE